MTRATYSFDKQGSERYVFTSVGKRAIVKFVDFSPTRTPNLYNVGFGDLLLDGSVDDTANSNNGDMVKVLATVVQIIKDFTTQLPEIKLIFFGSSQDRTNLYGRILTTYYAEFSTEFTITAFIKTGQTFEEIAFTPNSSNRYYAYFIKRIS